LSLSQESDYYYAPHVYYKSDKTKETGYKLAPAGFILVTIYLFSRYKDREFVRFVFARSGTKCSDEANSVTAQKTIHLSEIASSFR
jgi:hypothetical protein